MKRKYIISKAEQKACDLNQIRRKAYRHLLEEAREALDKGYANAYGIILHAHSELAAAEDKLQPFIRKHPQFEYAMRKTITDIYWDLTPHEKKLWDAIPELKTWRMKYE
jgi:hypothetical protein